MNRAVKLKNGSEEAESIVKVIMLTLEHLLVGEPIAFYDLVMKCRNESYSIFPKTAKKLGDLHLLDRQVNGTTSVHSSIRNIVLSGTEGENLDLKLTNPIVDEKGEQDENRLS